MLQPFEPFKPAFIHRLIRLNKKFIVTQSYKNSDERLDDGARQKIHLLVSDYEDHSSAQKHRDALRDTDKYAAVIHLDIPAHYKKLMELLNPDSPYVLFFAAIKSAKELERYLNINYYGHMLRWVQQNTAWPLRNNVGIRGRVQLIFGILYIELKYAGHSVKVKFEDLERA